MFNCMHVGGAVSGSDESEDEGEEDRGLGTTNLERMSLTSHKKKENESPSPVPKDASTSAWERLMQPDPMSLPSPSRVCLGARKAPTSRSPTLMSMRTMTTRTTVLSGRFPER